MPDRCDEGTDSTVRLDSPDTDVLAGSAFDDVGNVDSASYYPRYAMEFDVSHLIAHGYSDPPYLDHS